MLMYSVKVLSPDGMTIDKMPFHTRDVVIAGSKHEAKYFINEVAQFLDYEIENPKIVLDHKVYGLVNSLTRVHLVGSWAARRDQSILFDHCIASHAIIVDYTQPHGLFLAPSVSLIEEMDNNGRLEFDSKWRP